MTLANKITILRLLLIPVFLTAIAFHGPEMPYAQWIALGIFIVAAISDGVDGYLARHYNQRTKIGAVLDPTADKLLINLGYIFLAANREFDFALPYWFPVFILTREVTLVAGGALLHEFGDTTRRVRPRIGGKANMVLQIATMIAVLINFPWTYPIMYATVIVGALSWLDYIATGVREARQKEPA